MHKELAAAISRAHKKAKKHNGNIILFSEIERADRELLVRTNWLQEIIRGWYMLVRPDAQPGDTSVWYANFWDFVRIYLEETHGSNYCLSAENSIDIHIGNPMIPKQVIVITKKGGGKPVDLPFNTSILIYSDLKNFPPEQTNVFGLRVMTLPYALCKSTPTYFLKNETNVQIALGMLKDDQELIYVIATYNFVRSGERIIGAFAALHQEEKAEMLREQLRQVGMNLQGSNPFENEPVIVSSDFRSPHQGRILNLWAALRPVVIQNFPAPPGISKDKFKYLDQVEELYLKDAYNSLSIEGYQVDIALIERVKNNHWNPDLNFSDQQERNALAARGYYEAFLEVKKSILQILTGENPGKIIEMELQNWFQKLFSPNVNAGILQPNELIGFRKNQVYIRNSRHVPLPREALFDAMEVFFKCLKTEPHPAVRAILGHFMFVYIHPYMDGNGRLGRFIMNAMLASGGYPWTVISVANRTNYLVALENASVNHEIAPFTIFVKEEMKIGRSPFEL